MCPTRPEHFGGAGPRGPDPPKCSGLYEKDEQNIIYTYACACTHTHTHMHVCMWPLVFLHPSSTRSLVPHAQLLQHVRCRLGFVSAGHSSMNSLTRSLRKLALHHPWARTLSRMRMSREGWVACFRFSGGPDRSPEAIDVKGER